MYQILPCLEQGDLWSDSSDALIARTPVTTYICPSFRGPVLKPYTYANTTPVRAMSDYTANGGSWGQYSDILFGANSYDGALVPTKSVSALVRKLADVSDGTAHTLLVGEKFVDANFAYSSDWG